VLPQLDHQVILEPDYKNTGPAITWGIRHLIHKNLTSSEELVLIVPIDHYFSHEEAFMEKVLEAQAYAQEGSIISFGVPSRSAEVGYGYIHMTTVVEGNCYEVDQFIEKPYLALAQELVRSGQWLWNIGIYLLSVKTYIKEMELHAKELAALLYLHQDVESFYTQLSPISIDKSLMEYSKNLRVMQLTTSLWYDIGSWENIHCLIQQGESGFVAVDDIAHALSPI
jgi:mannose-1-phosphate guanylyltransferase